MGSISYKKRIQDPVHRSSTSFKRTHLLQPVRQIRASRRSRKTTLKKGSGENPTGISRILLKNLSGTKEKRKNEANHRPFQSEQSCAHSKFQNGNSTKGQKCHSPKRLGLFIGSHGRIFACVDSPSVSQISSVHPEQKGLPIQGATFRALDKSVCFHSSDVSNSYPSSQESYNSFSVPRRLVVKEPKSSTSSGTQTLHSSPDFITRTTDKSGEIRFDSIPEFQFHRDGISHSNKHSQNSPRKNSISSTDNKCIPSQKDSYSQTIPISFRETQCSCRFCSLRTPTSPTTTNVITSTMETSHPPIRSPNSDFSKHKTSSNLVEQSSEVSVRGSDKNSYTHPSTFHRRKCNGLGGSFRTRRDSTSRDLEPVSKRTPYQSSRVDGNINSTEICSSSYNKLNSVNMHRQHDCSFIHKETGRDSFSRSLSRNLENVSLVSTKQHQHCSKTHSRKIQHSGRPALKSNKTDQNRMVTQTISSEHYMSDDKLSKHRSFCNKIKPQDAPLRISNSRQSGIGDRRTNNGLEQDKCIRISPFPSYSSGAKQSSKVTVQNCSNSSSVAEQAVVSRSTESTDISSHNSSSNTRSSISVTRKNPASKPPNACPSRMGIIKQSIRNKQFSGEVAEHVSRARRESTRKVYDAKWETFTNWANQREIDPIKAPPHVIADFFLYLFNVKKYQVSTIKGYRSMLSNTLKFKEGYCIGSDPVISELMKSFQIQRPITRSISPKWDLAYVLTYLSKEPFEPLPSVSLMFLSMKTAFLLSMASAKRVSEVHAFSMDKQHLRFSSIDGSLTIRTQVGFLAKNQLPSKAPDSITIPCLYNGNRKTGFNKVLCPVRAVKIYLKRTKAIRGSRNRLFIPTKGNHDIKKSTISNWVKYTIKMAYQNITKRQLSFLKIRSHELRAFSASWAYFNSIPLNEILDAAVWSSSSTFAQFYLRDFRQQASNLSNLGPVVVAQKVVGGPFLRLPQNSYKPNMD